MGIREEYARREEAAWAALLAQVGRLTPEQQVLEGVVPGWSTRDLVWHCARWAEETAGHLEQMRSGDWVDPVRGRRDAGRPDERRDHRAGPDDGRRRGARSGRGVPGEAPRRLADRRARRDRGRLVRGGDVRPLRRARGRDLRVRRRSGRLSAQAECRTIT